MKIPEKGVVYKASARAFIGNYLIAAGVLILGLMVINRFDLVLDLTPTNVFEILGTAAYVGFVGVAFYLFTEFLWEGMTRHYVISNNEIVKVEGMLSIRRHAIPYQSVSEVRVTRGPVGRLLNYGTVEILGFGDSGLSMTHMINPEEIQRLIQHKVNLLRNAMTNKKKTDREDEAEIEYDE
jgi:membrane protein YdbS with pleckstrin-like domain